MGARMGRAANWHMAAAVLTLAGVAGCGGGGSTVSTPAPVVTPTPAPTATPTPTPTPSANPTASFITSEYNRSTGPAQHGAITAWAAGASGAGVTIGIVDSGIDTANPEFAGRIASASRDVAGNRGLINASSPHGTSVALVAAAARDGTGMMGMAWNATIAMFRADDPGTCGTAPAGSSASGCDYLDRDIAAGVDAAVAAGAKVINISLGGSAPAAVLRTAVTDAANAGVVVVVSAGNDGDSTDPGVDPANPDLFASGLAALGTGTVIIAGSVDATDTISTFSNRAGSYASSYLAARGERVCCVYENGVLKTVNNSDGTRSVFLFSGTSFAAPQIAGAIALLRGAFPNLTASQAVDILLRTARDAGTAGTDPVYGRGILDVAAAFARQGQTALAGSTVALPLDQVLLTTSDAMGDALAGTKQVTAVVLDSYQRAYRVDLAGAIAPGRLAARLAPALAGQTRSLGGGAGPVALAFTVDARGRGSALAGSAPLRLSASDGAAARVLAGRMIAQLAPRTHVALGLAQGADGLVAQVQGLAGSAATPAFLVARSPQADPGFVASGQASLALRRQWGDWGLTALAENGTIGVDALRQPGRPLDPRGALRRLGLVIDWNRDGLAAKLGASWLDEAATLLGARVHPGLGGHGAQSWLVDAGAAWSRGNWHLAAAWRTGLTRARGGGPLLAGTGLLTTGWSVEATRNGVLRAGDSLGLRIAQPLRVEAGALRLNLPVSYDYASLTPGYAVRELGLSPSGRELDAELAWRAPLWGGTTTASLFYRRNPGHRAAQPDDAGAALGWTAQF